MLAPDCWPMDLLKRNWICWFFEDLFYEDNFSTVILGLNSLDGYLNSSFVDPEYGSCPWGYFAARENSDPSSSLS